MNLTDEQCKEFKKYPEINPITGRHIEIGKITHQKLLKACDGSKKKTPQTVFKDLYIPPMGPMMHWKINAHKNIERENNLIDMTAHIEKRIEQIHFREAIYSVMEIQEFKDILKDAIHEFDGEKEYDDYFKDLLKKIKQLEKYKLGIDDAPKKTIHVATQTVYKHRYKNRENIAVMKVEYDYSLATIKDAIETGKVNVMISSGTIRDLNRDKEYLDYLIQRRIFTYDDIYKNTFKNEHVFSDLAEKYKKYRVIYKKVKGESPV